MELNERLSAYTKEQILNSESLDYVRWLSSLVKHNGQTFSAVDDYLRRWPNTMLSGRLQKAMAAGTVLATKAAAEPLTTTSTPGGASLAVIRPSQDAFVSLWNAASVLGRLKAVARPVGFNTTVIGETAGAVFRWTGQGAPKSTSNVQLSSTTLPILKAAGIIAISRELERLATPSSVVGIRNDLINGLAYFLDGALTDPTSAGLANVTPASITSTAPSIASAGSSEANVRTDIKALISAFSANNPGAERLVLLTNPTTATAIAVAFNSTTLGPAGGSIFGIPTLTSAAVGSRLILLDPAALVVADDGDAAIDVSRQASVEFDTSATSPPSASTVLINLWQSNLLGVRCERFVNWKVARASAVLFSNTAYV